MSLIIPPANPETRSTRSTQPVQANPFKLRMDLDCRMVKPKVVKVGISGEPDECNHGRDDANKGRKSRRGCCLDFLIIIQSFISTAALITIMTDIMKQTECASGIQ
ncbi:hypothetical protein MTO96_047783 [Rhipicephalus appendiculatus]